MSGHPCRTSGTLRVLADWLKASAAFSRSCSVSASTQAALASAALCFSASARFLTPVSRGVAASPCPVFCAVSLCTCSGAVLAPGGTPPGYRRQRKSPRLTALAPQQVVRLQRCTASCSSPLLQRPYHAAGLSRLPTPDTLYLSLTASSWPRTLWSWQAHLPWSGPVISQIPSGFPPLVAPLLYSSLRNDVNADLFYLLALQQACREGVRTKAHGPSCGFAAWCLFTLVRPTQAVGRPGRYVPGLDLLYPFLPADSFHCRLVISRGK